MAIAFVKSHGTNSNAASATTITIVPTSTIPAGNFVILGIGSSTSGSTATVADTKSNTYQMDQTTNGTARVCYIASSKITSALTTSDTITVTFNAARTLRLVALDEFSGLHAVTWKSTASPGSDGATGTSTTPQTGGTALTVAAGSLSYGACVFGDAGAAYAPGSTLSLNYVESNEVKLSGSNGLETMYLLAVPGTATPIANGTITNASWTQINVCYTPGGNQQGLWMGF